MNKISTTIESYFVFLHITIRKVNEFLLEACGGSSYLIINETDKIITETTSRRNLEGFPLKY